MKTKIHLLVAAALLFTVAVNAQSRNDHYRNDNVGQKNFQHDDYRSSDRYDIHQDKKDIFFDNLQLKRLEFQMIRDRQCGDWRALLFHQRRYRELTHGRNYDEHDFYKDRRDMRNDHDRRDWDK